MLSQPRITARIERTEDEIVHTYELDGVVYDSLTSLQAALDNQESPSAESVDAVASAAR